MAKMTKNEKEHYAEVMFNKTFDRLTKEEKKNLKSYYEAENQYLETIKKYGESEISQGVKRLYNV